MYASGRWTQRGQPVVYTSASISLAVLEYTVNYRRRGWVPATVLGRVSIPPAVQIETVLPADLPPRWFAADPPQQLQNVGDKWLRRGKTAVLQVPSAIVTEEWNYLLNPLHVDFRKLKLSMAERFNFDRRLARSKRR